MLITAILKVRTFMRAIATGEAIVKREEASAARSSENTFMTRGGSEAVK